VPAHPIALAILRAARIPLAAPSANRSTRLSPTRAEHVLRDLNGLVDLILDGGPTSGGLESTVLDVSISPPRLLRPGLITPAQIEAVTGPIQRDTETTPGPLRSPGMLGRHYAPRTPLELAAGDGTERVDELRQQGKRVGWLVFEPTTAQTDDNTIVRQLPREPAAYAAGLYTALHTLDDAGVDCIIVARPPPTEEWLAIRDRLRRAALHS
jgi:L-threonylcarbamoyladenylate synthase